MTNQELWKAALGEIELELSKANFLTWFKNTAIADQKEGVITVNVPNTFIKEWLEDKYHKLIIKSLRNYSRDIRNIEYNISSGTLADAPKINKTKDAEKETSAPESQLEFREFQIDKETNLNPRYTFETFIVGEFNEMAHAASLSITKNLGHLYNPLFIYGGVGLGKTHLTQALGNSIKQSNPDIKIKYLSSEKFASDFVSAMQNADIPAFKTKYRKYDVLILDDVQFLASKMKVQEVFFDVFNELYDNNKQIILSADRPPKSFKELEERIRSRFEGGLMAHISEPDYESRLAILKAKAEAKKFNPSNEILEFIASYMQTNIRELEGALNSIIARERFSGRPTALEEVKEILNKNAQPKKILTAAQIIKAVAGFYNIEEKTLFEKTRKKEVVQPRQIAMYLLREDFNGSYPYIGQKFGGRDHTTAIHSYLKVAQDIKKGGRVVEEIKTIRENLYNTA
ncbi:MAG: chromosomal replication initiator protein DnaA [Patescibacteria group bacterium]